MKIFKILFSKTFIVGMMLLVQIALICTVFAFFNYFFVFFRLIDLVLSMLVFFAIINKKECPEFKLPWIVVIFLAPLFGLVIYLLFANPKMKKSEIKRIREIQNQMEPYHAGSETEEIPEFREIAGYLERTSYQSAHCHNRVTYYKVGEEFWQGLLSELQQAKKFIFMEYFIIDNGKMWDSIHEILLQKAQSGVEVRLIYDDIGSAGKVRGNYYKKLRNEGIQCYKFNPFRPILSGVYNNRDHRKITVIDGKVGFTGGINLGDEYVNEISRFGHWKDTAIRIEGSAVNNLTEMFLQVFEMTAKQVSDYEKYLNVTHEKFAEPGGIIPFGDGPRPYYREQIGENNYINLIHQAKRFVYITTPYLIIDHNVASALRNAALKGVDVRIVTPHIPDKKMIFNMTRSNYPQLLEAGVRIYEYTPGFLHAKSLIADDKFAFVGTINLDYRSLVHHYECGAVMYDTPCIRDIKEDFLDVFAVSEEITTENFHMGKIARVLNSLLTLFTPML